MAGYLTGIFSWSFRVFCRCDAAARTPCGLSEGQLSELGAGLPPRGRWFVGLGASGAAEGPAGRESRIVIGTEKTSQCAFTNDKSPRSSSPASLPCRVIDEARFQRRLNKFFLTPDIISMKDNFVSGTVVAEPPLATTGVLTDGGW
jgi:hypothetical protein